MQKILPVQRLRLLHKFPWKCLALACCERAATTGKAFSSCCVLPSKTVSCDVCVQKLQILNKHGIKFYNWHLERVDIETYFDAFSPRRDPFSYPHLSHFMTTSWWWWWYNSSKKNQPQHNTISISIPQKFYFRIFFFFLFSPFAMLISCCCSYTPTHNENIREQDKLKRKFLIRKQKAKRQ